MVSRQCLRLFHAQGCEGSEQGIILSRLVHRYHQDVRLMEVHSRWYKPSTNTTCNHFDYYLSFPWILPRNGHLLQRPTLLRKSICSIGIRMRERVRHLAGGSAGVDTLTSYFKDCYSCSDSIDFPEWRQISQGRVFPLTLCHSLWWEL